MLDDQGTTLHHVFGVREEYNLTTFSRGMACDVYLATTHFTQDVVPLSILVIAEVTPGLSAGCDLLLSTKIYLDIWFSNNTMEQGYNTTEDNDVYNTTEGAKLAAIDNTLSIFKTILLII